MSVRNKQSNAPRHVTAEAKQLWRRVVSENDLSDEAGKVILQTGLEAFDRMRSAQAQIEKDGQTTTDRFGQVKAHPLLAIERDARAQFLAALKQLNLDLEPLRDRPGRPARS
jgi:P27 family predicted phage terminase small subunit